MSIIEESNKYVLNTYSRYPLAFKHGEGMWLYSDNDEKYLDLASGIAVSSLGHNHPAIVEAVTGQVAKLIHTSNLYYTEPYVALAKKLVDKTIFDKVFFCNSGAEANEAAIKMSRKHGSKVGDGTKNKIIAMKSSFHGRTIATLSATGQLKKQKGFEPLLPGVVFVNANDRKELEAVFNDEISALIIEPVLAEGGVRNVDKEYLKLARELCDKYNSLLIFDEVQTGMGRTGKLFAYEHFSPIEPDVITSAKGLAGGFPIGAALVKKEFTDLLGPGEHASTFGGNLVCCSAANAVIDTFYKENLIKNAEDIGKYFIDRLNSLKSEFKIIKEVRGLGLLIGVEVEGSGKDIINKLIENKILTVPAGENVVRFLPPLIIQKEHVDIAVEALEKILRVAK